MNFFKTILFLSLSGSIFSMVLFLLEPLTKNKINKNWYYYIWLIAIVRFLIPFGINISFNQNSYYEENLTSITQNSEYDNSSTTSLDNNVLSIKEFNFIEIFKNNILFLWFFIFTILVARKITSYYSFVKFVKSGNSEIYDEEIIGIYTDSLSNLQIKKPLPIYENRLLKSPMIIGIFNRFIVLNETSLSEENIYNIFLHELIHHKKNDIFYKWLLELTCCIHFFNPLIYFVKNKISKLCELSCDETLIQYMCVNEKKIYCKTLIESLKHTGDYGENNIATNLNEDAKILKERLENIMKFKKSNLKTIFLSTFLSIILIFFSLTTGVYGGSKFSINIDYNINKNIKSEIEDNLLEVNLNEMEDENFQNNNYSYQNNNFSFDFEDFNFSFDFEDFNFNFNPEGFNFHFSENESILYQKIDIFAKDDKDALKNGFVKNNDYYSLTIGPFYDSPTVIFDFINNVDDYKYNIGSSSSKELKIVNNMMGNSTNQKLKKSLTTFTGNENIFYVFLKVDKINDLKGNIYIKYSEKNNLNSKPISLKSFNNSEYVKEIEEKNNYNKIKIYGNVVGIDLVESPDNNLYYEYDKNSYEYLSKIKDNTLNIEVNRNFLINNAKSIKIYIPKNTSLITTEVQSSALQINHLTNNVNIEANASSVNFSMPKNYTNITNINSNASSNNILLNKDFKMNLKSNVSSLMLSSEFNDYKKGKNYSFALGNEKGIINLDFNASSGSISILNDQYNNMVKKEFLKITSIENKKGIFESNSFNVEKDCQAELIIKSSLVNSNVVLHLFNPSFKETAYNIKEGTTKINLTKGTWAWNCSGTFDSGQLEVKLIEK